MIQATTFPTFSLMMMTNRHHGLFLLFNSHESALVRAVEQTCTVAQVKAMHH